MHITTKTLTTLRVASIFVLATLLFASLAGCDRAGTIVSQLGEARTPAPAAITVLTGRVVGVADGDTLTLLDRENRQHTIRLAEIDAPERAQPWGNRSRQALSAMVMGKSVTVQQTDTDRYGRVVGRVFANGEDVNRSMVGQGAAWAYRAYLTDETLIATESRARRARTGLWSMGDAQTVAPWEWRKGTRVGEGDISGAPPQREPAVRSLFTPQSPAAGSAVDGQFSCSGKRFCRQMTSCAEAHFYLQQCGVSSLDGNSDGEPCEMLCGTAGR